MRKLIVEEWISLDGYAEGKNGKLDFFPTTEANKQSDEDQLKFLDTVDTILLGRKTYNLFVDFWPGVSNDVEIIAHKLNSIPKVVISNTLHKAPWGDWDEAKVLAGDAVEGVRKLKEKEGKNIVLWGSISLVQLLMKEDLIDEFRIQICPTIIGGGKSLFSNHDHYVNLKLISTKMYNTGVVLLQYERE